MDFLESYQVEFDSTLAIWEAVAPFPQETALPSDVFSVIFQVAADISLVCSSDLLSGQDEPDLQVRIFEQMLTGKRFEAQRQSHFRFLTHLAVGSVFGYLGGQTLDDIASTFRSVTSLDISNADELNEEIKSLGKMTQLRSLRLDGCTSLTGKSFKTIASALTNLTWLSSRRCSIEEAVTLFPQLEYLDLYSVDTLQRNDLQGWQVLTRLTYLDITSSCHLQLSQLANLPLQTLIINDRNKCGPPVSKVWPRTLRKLSYANFPDTRHNYDKPSIAAIETYTSLETLWLPHDNVWYRRDRADFEFGRLPGSITDLDLSGTGINAPALNLLFLACPNLKILKLSSVAFLAPRDLERMLTKHSVKAHVVYSSTTKWKEDESVQGAWTLF